MSTLARAGTAGSYGGPRAVEFPRATIDEPAPDRNRLRNPVLLIGLFVAFRLAVSWFFPATIDEAYAISVSRAWSLSYYDHPPIGFSLARLTAWAAGTESIFLVRIPFVLAGAASAWLVYDITRLAYGSAAAFGALCWFSVAPFFFLSAGHFVVPDGPLNLFLLMTLRLVLPDLLKIGPETGKGSRALSATPAARRYPLPAGVSGPSANPGRPLRTAPWLAAGICFGLAVASKYQAVLFGASALAFLLTSRPHRRLLQSPVLWATLAVSCLGLAPVVIWNAGHDWVSISFQAGRAGSGHLALHPANLLRTMLGQAVYVLPGTWLIILATALSGVCRPVASADRLFGWLALVPPAVFGAIALVSPASLPHWAMSGFLFGFPLMGRWTAGVSHRLGGVIGVAWRLCFVAIPALALAVAVQARHGVFTRPLYDAAPRWDVNWQMQEWTALRDAWPKLGAPPIVVVRNWTVGAKAGHALGPEVAVVPMHDPRHFQYLQPGEMQDAVAVEAVNPEETAQMAEVFVRMLRGARYRVTDDPQIIGQRDGGFLRFNIVAIRVERAG